MEQLIVWIYLPITVGIALLANFVSAMWAKQKDRFSWWLLAVLLISPLVFITFGLVTERTGVAIAAGMVDSLLSVGTIAIGLFFFGEWKKLNVYHYVGLICILVGLALLQFQL